MNEDTEYYLWDNELLAKDEEYFLLDDLGSPLRQLTRNGQTTTEYGYDEFGQSLFDTSNQQPFGFTGYQMDEVSELNYAQARYYDQAQGRFTGEDSVKGIKVLPQTLNAYSYVWNNPLSLIDKDGYFPSLSDIGKGVGNAISNVGDWLGNNVFGTKNTIDITPPKLEGETFYAEVSETKTEKSGGSIFTLNSKNGKVNGVSINLPSIETPWGKIGFEGTSLGLSWGDGLSVDATASVEAFSYGASVNAGVTLGSHDIVGVNAKVSAHNEDSTMGIGTNIGLTGDTKLFGFNSKTDENGVTTTTKLGIKIPTWRVFLVAACFALPYVASALAAISGPLLGITATAMLIMGNVNEAKAAECLS